MSGRFAAAIISPISNFKGFSLSSFSCFSSSVCIGLDGPDDALGAGLGDELIPCAGDTSPFDECECEMSFVSANAIVACIDDIMWSSIDGRFVGKSFDNLRTGLELDVSEFEFE